MNYKIGEYIYIRFNKGNRNVNPLDEWGEFFMFLKSEKLAGEVLIDVQGFYRNSVYTVSLTKDIEYIQKFPFQAKDEVVNLITNKLYVLTGIKYRKSFSPISFKPDYIDRHFFLQSDNDKSIKVNFDELLRNYKAI